jgi:predicted N-acetyltransferase YhbS
MHPQVRSASTRDTAAVSAVILAAFGASQGAEIHALVAALLADPTAMPTLSLVAEMNGQVAGHILFTHARIEGAPSHITAAILAPLAVHPDHQRRGLGGHLIREGLQQCTAAGCDLVFVLGHPRYYPRHGFVTAGRLGFEAPYVIPPEHADAWMVQELRPGTLGTVRGRVICADALMDPRHWIE